MRQGDTTSCKTRTQPLRKNNLKISNKIRLLTQVRELFELARSKKACVIFFDEVDAFGGARFDDGSGGDKEVQRTMLELINQLDGFDARGNIKVLKFDIMVG